MLSNMSDLGWSLRQQITTGEKIAYSMKWSSLEPNNLGGVEQCLSLGEEGYLYNDINCYGQLEHQFICEKVHDSKFKFQIINK